MFLQKKLSGNSDTTFVPKKFQELWSRELFIEVGSRDFSKAYNYIAKRPAIRDWAIEKYFNFVSSDSPRFKDVCDVFDAHYAMRAFLSLLDFDSVPLFETTIKNFVEKRNFFLTEKCTESAVVRHSVNWYIEDVLENHAQEAEAFIKSALEDMKYYKELKEKRDYKSACRIALLTDTPEDYPANIKKYLYYAACRPITEDNLQQTLDYFDYVKKYFSFNQTLENGELLSIMNIDVIICEIAFLNNGGKVNIIKLEEDIIHTVEGYCREHLYTPVFLLIDYLYLIGETTLEMLTLETLFKNEGCVNYKYRKRYSFLKLVYQTSNSFVLRNSSKLPLECIIAKSDDKIPQMLIEASAEKEKHSWCICLKQKIDTVELSSNIRFSDKILNILERVLNNEFGEYAIEGIINTFFNNEFKENAFRSILILTSGENRQVHFPKIGVLIRVEPITKCFLNVSYSILYLPDETRAEKDITADFEYIQSFLNNSDNSIFNSFYKRIETLVWNTVNNLSQFE